ncbi:MAG: hypothetical protein ACRDP3_04700 [Streptomyces sp.]|uniref:hypothetical protein n=1 Tax=Streptomyces sp. TaxID=1931 RepID=UPI003D6A1958
MAQAVRHNPVSLLLADRKAHPLENTFAAATIVLGAVAFITAMWHGLHVVSSWTGLVGILTGAWGQFISATTGERFVLIIGLGAAAVGFYLGMAYGGLLG